MTAGLVVAGGYSTRFGIVEKPLVEVAGDPMFARVVGTLSAVVDEVVIDCRDDQVRPFEAALAEQDVDLQFAVDDEPDRGPVAGLATGLAEIPDPETIVVSCDRPGVTPALFDHLQQCRRTHDVDVALPAIGGHLQPLCGAYGTVPLQTAVERALESGERRLCAIPRALSRRVVTERALATGVGPASIASVDTPLDARLWSPSTDRSDEDECRSARCGPSPSVVGD